MNTLTSMIRGTQDEESSLTALVRKSYTDGTEGVDAQRKTGTTAEPAAFGGKDTVDISEEGRAKLRADEEQARVSGGLAGLQGKSVRGASGEEETGDEAARLKESLMKQIKEVKQKLEEAQQKLAQATANTGGTPSSPAPESKAVKAGENGAQGGEAASAQTEQMVSAAMTGMSGNMEAEAVQQEITQLQAQLQNLYSQLQQATQGGGGGGGTGTAGIGGEANGPSGQGERISVSA